MSVATAQSYARAASGRPLGKNWPWLAAAAVVAVLAYGPLLGLFFAQQWQKPHYQYFPFVIVAFVWLLWQRYVQGEPRDIALSRGLWLDRLLLAAAVGVLAYAIVIRSPWGAMASFIVLALYGCVKIARVRRVVNLWGVWFLLCLLMPLPFSLDNTLIQKLQAVSSRISSFVLDAVGVNHFMEGNTLTLPDKQLFVDEACSGIISILSVVACAVIYAVVKNRTPLHMVLLAAIGIGWATVINVGRISSIAFIYDRWGIDWSSGAPHEILSLVLFLITFAALLSSDLILLVCLEPVAATWHQAHATDLRLGAFLSKAWDWIVTLGNPISSASDAAGSGQAGDAQVTHHSPRLGLWRPILLFTPLAIIQGGLFVFALTVAPEKLPAVQRGIALSADYLPATIGELKKKGFNAQQRTANDIHGKYSRTYEYVGPDGAVYVVSFDFPFSVGWHELSQCYLATGWSLVKRDVRSAPEGAGDWQFIEVDFEKAGETFGTVMFSEFDQFGVPLREYEGWQGPLGGSFLAVRNQYLETRKTMQVQVFVAGRAPITDAQRLQARELLRQVRGRFHQLTEKPDRYPSQASDVTTPAS